MKKALLPLLFCFLWLGAMGQNCEPSFDCNSAPILCGADLDGLQASTVFDSPTYTIPSGFGFVCQNSVIDNNQWIGFSPCTPSVNLLIQVNDCWFGNGLQAVIFETVDCQNFVVYSNCLPEIAPFSTGILTAFNLVPGNVYYLMIDGFSGDVCDYEISVVSGIDTNLPIFGSEMPGFVEGPSEVGCGTPFGFVEEYSVTPPSCENMAGSSCAGSSSTPDDFCYFYHWDLPPGAYITNHSPNYDEVTIDFGSAVSGFITVTHEFDDQCTCHCGYCPTSLNILPFFVQVNQPMQQVLPPLTMCEGDAFFFCGQMYQIEPTGNSFECTIGCVVQVQQVIGQACPANCAQYNLPVPPGNTCATAAPFCASYLNGYCSNNGAFTASAPGNLTSAFGCSIENNQWLTFVPCEDSVAFVFSVGNCVANEGLEFAVFSTPNCQDFTALAGCTTVAPGAIGLLQVPNLQIGDTYYLMVDGVNGDACNWEITGLYGVSGGEVLQEDITPGHIDGLCDLCLDSPTSSSQPIAYTAIGPDCKIIPADPNNNTCVPTPDFCPPAPQKFSEPFLDTLIQAVAWDTVWQIIPPTAGHFENNDNIGTIVYVVWDSVGHFKVDADIVPIAWDTIPFLNTGIRNCAIICPDDDPCDIPPKDVNVGAPVVIFETYPICPGECAFAHNQLFCNPGQFLITETDSTGCLDTIIINIFEFPPFGVSVVGTIPTCYGEPATATANAIGQGSPFSYHWSNGQNIQSISGLIPGTYSVTVTNFYGCISTGSYSFNWQPPIPTTTLPPLSLCANEVPYDFYGTTVNSSGNYIAVLVSWQGCDSSITQNITVLPPVNASITSSVGTNLPPSETAILDAGSGFASYLWNDSSTGQTLSTDQPGTYSVTVTTTQGCTGTASITLTQFSPACPNFNLPVAPSDSCSTAPPFCASYLSNYCSSNFGFTPDSPGNLNSVIPCTIENNQWLKFVACADTVQLILGVNSCAGAMGLEFFVLQTVDCQMFTAQAACFEIADGTSDTLNLFNLQSGDTYYLMVDGIGGDVCNWEVLSTSGISDGATFQEDNTPGQVTGPTALCAGSTATYTFTSPICDLIPVGGCPAAVQQFCGSVLDTCNLVQYDTIWHVTPFGTAFVNNDSMGLTVTVIFPDSVNVPPDSSMVFTISVDLVPIPDTTTCCLSACATIIPDTEPCGILPLQVTICNPANSLEMQVVCPGDCVDFYGQTFCQPGTYTVVDTTQCGCQNSHELILDWIQEPIPAIANLTENCDPTGVAYTVSFEVIAFGNYFITVNGQPLNGINFTSAPIQSGQPYSFLVEEIGQCQIYSENVSGDFTCPPCNGGTFDLGTMALCPGESFPLLGNTYSNPGSYSEMLLNAATNCFETYNFILQQIVENQLVVGPTTEFCDASNLYYSVGFSINSGNPPYLVNGNPVTGNSYQSGLIPSGQAYAFTVTDAATCNPQTANISGSYTCACLNSPGTVNLSTINKCEGEMADANFNNNAILGLSDIHVFILHTSPSNSLGSVIGTNTTGSFGYVPGLMSFGQTYYISPAVGPDQGGTVDVNSACFSLSPGQPVVFYEKPAVDIVPPSMLNCTLNSLMLNSLASGGSGDFSYDWSGPGNFASTAANPMVSEPGAYLLTLTDNVTACQDQSATAVTSDNSPPVFTVTSSEINCQQPSAILVAASQMPGVTYTWTLPTGDVMTGDTITTNIPGGYTVSALGPNGCTADAATFVTDNGTPPSVTATSETINCGQPTAELTATSNEPLASFVWTLPDTTTSTGQTLVTSLIGAYSVIATAPNGCTAEASAMVLEGPDPVLQTEVEVRDPTCHGDSDGSITVLGSTGGTAPYEYVLNDSLVGDSFPGLSAGSYVLTTTDANGCMGLDTIQVVDPPEVTVQIGDDQFINLGQSVTLTMQSSITPQSIVWSGPDGKSWQDANALTISPTESGQYFIVISDVSSCRSSDTTYIYVNGQGKVFVPNVFSPNGDGENDVLMIFGGGDIAEVLDIQIFDRWGEMVFQDNNFQPNDPAHGWDGRHKGKAMDPAVFVVKAMVLFRDGTKKMVTGDVLLMR